MRWNSLTLAFLGMALLSGPYPDSNAGFAFAQGKVPKIEFARDIRPILSENCFKCHGPDENTREAGLRLDTRDGATTRLDSGNIAVVANHPVESKLIERVTASDPDVIMPPPSTGKTLAPRQIEMLKQWIEQGAEWKGHWSFHRAERPAVPAVKAWPWPRNPIDHFILERLEDEGLLPSPPADKENLIRRVTLDLTGLPPTIEEVDAFLADKSPDAYEKVVDRLLASPRYGEHLARFWLDAARYGDTHGLHLDNERVIWPYRDWVINAYNQNMPFDQFTIEQLAGDLLPNPTLSQRVATGFNRCNVTTSEGGSIDEEYYVRYAVDRVETTSTVFMGLTLGCAVCHDHKYDPISQKEFYQLFAFFNSLTEKAMDGNAKAPPPVIRVPSAEQSEALARVQARIAEAQAQLDAPMPEVDAAQVAWEQEWSGRLAKLWQVLDPGEFTSTGGASLRKLDDGSVLAEGTNPSQEVYEVTARTTATGIFAFRLEALTHETLPAQGPGRADNSNFVLSEFEVEAASASDPEKFEKVKFTLAHADYSQTSGGYLIEKAIDGIVDGTNGWAVDGNVKHENRTAYFVASAPLGFSDGTLLRIRLRHESQFERHAIGRFRLSLSTDGALAPAKLSPWLVAGPFKAESGAEAYRKAFEPEEGIGKPLETSRTFDDGKLKWVERKDFADGKVHDLRGENAATYLSRAIETASPRKVTLRFGSDDALKVWINGQVVLDRNLQRSVEEDKDTVQVPLNAGVNELFVKVVNYAGAYAFSFEVLKEESGAEWLELADALSLPADQRTPEHAAKLRAYFRQLHAPRWADIQAEIQKLKAEEKGINDAIPTTLVMEDSPTRRDAFVLVRGEYAKKGEKVEPTVPAVFPPLPEGLAPNRLALAHWLVDPAHPLTARVAVNRYWQQFFGTGIVKTAEDFGAQGEWPSHPELLDWLATEFVNSGWDVKAMQRLIATSATYRQSSKVSPELLHKDAENRLLARGPRFRMDAEMVRDNALFTSGLLVGKIGDQSVKPYQPSGIWEAVGYVTSNTANFKRDSGEALYRRSMYTFWKRTAPPPTMLIFDAPSRESCTVRRARTNTPLQALALLNDEQFVETARHLAERILVEGGSSVADRATFAFRLLTARMPDAEEISILDELHQKYVEQYRAEPESATKLLSVGESGRNESLDVAELAAWTMIANLLLNLDETVTKG